MSTENPGIVSYYIGMVDDGYVFMEKTLVGGEAEHVTQSAGCFLEDADFGNAPGLSEAVKNLDALFAAVKEGEKFLHLHP